MSDSTLRTAIARAFGAEADEVYRPAFGGRQLHDKQIAAITDAVLAVLADPPFEVWERCVNRIEVDDMDQRARENIVNTVLRAVLETGEDDE